ncbi:peptidase M15 [Nocardiopsis sp. TSRI0078]|uniref:D-alanyl-D-alanine carboxypeptidase family protein n=1 Tax=unclassified Nocardiopsis TaxID=2649073 RepID=UPI00093EAE19|nr:D-alanyl-D-alanine carboxypeptidase family protein [Nocardiopsis sp. TSRI0078]OKI22005.1 peptidase M15 [Nocardiopsis sp. TSRI0078]
MPFTSDAARRRSRVPGGSGVLTAFAKSYRVRFAQAVTLVVVTALLVAPIPVSALDPAEASLEEFRQRAEAASEELEEATNEQVERQEALEEAQEELVDTLYELQQTEIELREMREPLAQLASTLYKQPDGGVLAVLASGSLNEDLQMQSYASKISEDNQALIQEATDLREEQVDLTSEAQELQTTTQLEQVELAADIEQLRQRSEETTNELVAELEERGIDPEAYMAAADCDPSAASNAQGAANGLLPGDSLCDLYDGKQLRADAAVDFLQLNARYVDEYGENMCITSAYRDLPNQHRVYAQVAPGFAAVPGTSNHGLGKALDLGCGIQNYRSDRWLWMEANGAEFGWHHPAWAKSSPFEPWHWEYSG